MSAGPKLWLRDELFEHGVLHVPAGDVKRVTPTTLVAAVTELLAAGSGSSGGPAAGEADSIA